ncbi:MAG: hypothetical protein M3416_01500 [Acidobacteriota bacterium]|nr:hypothetical protein [Acidobacteriota bacterium]
MTPPEEARLRARYRELLGRVIFDLGLLRDAAAALGKPVAIFEGMVRTLRGLLKE